MTRKGELPRLGSRRPKARVEKTRYGGIAGKDGGREQGHAPRHSPARASQNPPGARSPSLTGPHVEGGPNRWAALNMHAGRDRRRAALPEDSAAVLDCASTFPGAGRNRLLVRPLCIGRSVCPHRLWPASARPDMQGRELVGCGCPGAGSRSSSGAFDTVGHPGATPVRVGAASMTRCGPASRH